MNQKRYKEEMELAQHEDGRWKFPGPVVPYPVQGDYTGPSDQERAEFWKTLFEWTRKEETVLDTVHLMGIPDHLSTAEVILEFFRYGAIEAVMRLPPGDGNRSFMWIQYTTPICATRAVWMAHGRHIESPTGRSQDVDVEISDRCIDTRLENVFWGNDIFEADGWDDIRM